MPPTNNFVHQGGEDDTVTKGCTWKTVVGATCQTPKPSTWWVIPIRFFGFANVNNNKSVLGQVCL